MQLKVGTSILELVEGDITQQDTEAIVNAANEQLRVGGAVDGAINRAGGRKIQEEARKIGHCPTGQAVHHHGRQPQGQIRYPPGGKQE